MQINCPYCNAVIAEDVLASSGPRVRCPRCGDSFPNRWSEAITAAPLQTQSSAIADTPRRSNRQIAFVVLGVMATMAVIGLIYALWTAPARQARHPDPIKYFEAKEYRPDNLPALGYLPFDSKIVATVQVAELQREKLGQQLLAEPRWQPLDWALERIKLWTDLTPDAIDHIAAGVQLPNDDFPCLVLVVQTRRPYSLSALREKHSQTVAEKFYDRPLFRFNILPIGEGCLWCADARTLVFMLRPDAVEREHLDRIPLRPLEGVQALPEVLQRLIKEELPRQPTAWLVGDLRDLAAKVAWLKLTPLPDRVWDYLSKVKTTAVGVELRSDDVGVKIAIEGSDLGATYALQQLMEKAGGKELRIFGPPPAAVVAATCLGHGASNAMMIPALFTPNKLLVQFRGDANRIRETLTLSRK